MALTVPSNGGFISIDTTTSKTFQLPFSKDLVGRVITFKDKTGNASNQPILLQTQGGDTFENGTTSYSISEAFGSATFVSRYGQWVLQQGNTQIIASTVAANYFLGDGSLLTNLNAISSLQLASTIQGLGTYGYVSTLSLYSTTAGLENYISSFIDPTELASTVVGLGSAGFLSSIGLDTKLASTVQGLGTSGYISSLSLYSSLTGSLSTFSSAIGPVVSPSNLFSTVDSLGSAGYVSTLSMYSSIDVIITFLSTITGNAFYSNFTSTVAGLGSAGYVSTASLYSSITGSLSTFSTAIGPVVSPSNLFSTVQGLGSAGYVSTASLVSTTSFLQTEIQYGFSTLSSIIQTAGAYTAQTLYLNESVSVSPYKQLGANEIINPILYSTITSVPGTSDSNLLCAFQTDFPLPTFIPKGLWDLNLFVDSGAANSIFFYYNLYFRASGGAESLLFQSRPVPVGNTGIQQYTNSLVVDYTPIPNGSTIVLKVYGSNINSPTRTVTCYFQDSYYSHVHTTFNGVSYSGGSGISSLSTTVANNYDYFSSQIVSTNLNLFSTVQGLGSAGYVSTASLYSSIAGSLSSFSTSIGPGGTNMLTIMSTVAGLGTSGYVSTASLYSSITGSLSSFSTAIGPGGTNILTITSTVEGLGSAGYISTSQLVSTTLGLQTYISSFIDVTELTSTLVSTVAGIGFQSNLTSTVRGLGSAGYVSTSQLTSTVTGLGGIYVSTLTLRATVSSFSTAISQSFNSSNVIISTLFASNATMSNLTVSTITFNTGDGFLDFPDIRALSLSTFFINTSTINVGSVVSTQVLQVSSIVGLPLVYTSNLQSTVDGLGSSGYVSTASLYSSINGSLSSFSTAIGPGGINMTTITSTVAGLGTAGYVSSLSLYSSINGSLSSFSTAIGPGGTNMLTIQSTVEGLGSAGYVSTLSLYSSINGSLSSFSTAIGPGGTNMTTITSTVEGLGSAGYVSTLSLYSSISASLSSFSTAIGPGGINMLTIQSTVEGLGSAGYVSTLSLYSSINGSLSSFSTAIGPGGTNITTITSTVAGLGTAGYVSTSQLTSTVSNLYNGIFPSLSTLSLSSGTVSLSTLIFIDITTQTRNTLLVSSGTLTLNGAAVGGGGGGSSGLTVSNYVVAGKLNADQTIPSNTDTTIQFLDDFDPQGWYNPANYHFSPNIAGYYVVTFQVWFDTAAAATNQLNIQIVKNGADTMAITQLPQANLVVGQSLNVTKIIYMNGSTDYLYFQAYSSMDSTRAQYGGTTTGSGTFFTATLLTNGSSGTNIISTVEGLGTAGYVSTLTLNAAISSFSTALGPTGGGGGSGDVTKANLTSTVQGLGTYGYISTQQLASFSFFTVQSGTSYTASPYGQQLMTLSNISYQFSPVVLSNDGITLNVSTNTLQTYRISYMTGVNQATFTVPRPTIAMAVSTPSNVVYYPAVESIDAGGGSVTFLEQLDSNSQILFYMNGLSNYTFTDADSSLYRLSFEQVQGSVGQVFSTTYFITSFNEFTSSCTFYEDITVKKSTMTSNLYVSSNATINNLNVFGTTTLANLTVLSTATIGESTITNTLYTNYLRVMCNAIIGASSVVIEANNIATSNLQTSSLSILDQSTMTYKPFFISSGSIYYGSNLASSGGSGSNVVATGGSTISSLFVGSSSNQNFIKFWGSIGEYNNTVIAQQSTGGGSDELLFFQGSTINDQFRFQTTGSVRFETGVSQPRNFCNANQIITPTVLINSSSNVGIMTNNPSYTLDVTGSGRFTTLLSTTNLYAGAFYMGLYFA